MQIVSKFREIHLNLDKTPYFQLSLFFNNFSLFLSYLTYEMPYGWLQWLGIRIAALIRSAKKYLDILENSLLWQLKKILDFDKKNN